MSAAVEYDVCGSAEELAAERQRWRDRWPRTAVGRAIGGAPETRRAALAAALSADCWRQDCIHGVLGLIDVGVVSDAYEECAEGLMTVLEIEPVVGRRMANAAWRAHLAAAGTAEVALRAAVRFAVRDGASPAAVDAAAARVDERFGCGMRPAVSPEVLALHFGPEAAVRRCAEWASLISRLSSSPSRTGATRGRR